ncbi:MAG: sigma-54 interaction domain-containing protein [Anaerovoracaceae bacterium]
MKQYSEQELNDILEKYYNTLYSEFKDSLGNSQMKLIKEVCIGDTKDQDPIIVVKSLFEQILWLLRTLEACPYSIYITGSDGSSKYVNRAFENITGLKRSEVIDRNITDLEKNNVFSPFIYKVVAKERAEVSQLQSIKNEKDKVFITAVPVYDNNGNLTNVISNSYNVAAFRKLTSYINSKEDEPIIKGKNIIAESIQMKNIMAVANAIAKVDSTVLITGESGVGKGVLASYIHNNSERKTKKFVHINCGAIPEQLLESELFGYEKGAFTGANNTGKKGLIELADKGTLFLDEISELPLMLQVKLLKFLQDKIITPVGSTEEIKVDARIIAATNKDLEKLVKNGSFREDLFYRINVIPIEIPPLRDRKEDIYPAAIEFINYFGKKYNKNVEINSDFKGKLESKGWKGNMRELENYIERYVIMAENANIAHIVVGEKEEMPDVDSELNSMTLEGWMNKCEETLIKSVYNKYHNTYKIAEVLGISQPSASRKVRKYIKKILK